MTSVWVSSWPSSSHTTSCTLIFMRAFLRLADGQRIGILAEVPYCPHICMLSAPLASADDTAGRVGPTRLFWSGVNKLLQKANLSYYFSSPSEPSPPIACRASPDSL